MYLPNHHGPAVRISTTAGTRALIDAADHDRDGDDDDYDDESNYENGATGSRSQWIVAIAVIICGLGGVVFLRRRFASFPIGQLPLPFSTPPARRPRAYETIAPYPGDDAIFGPASAVDETSDPIPPIRLNRYETFSPFPDLGDFGADSDA
jgi:hypothetical protein